MIDSNLISRGPKLGFRFFAFFSAAIWCVFIAAMLFSEYAIHTQSLTSGAWTMVIGVLIVFSATGLFIKIKLVDCVYAEIDLLSIKRGRRGFQIPYADIRGVNVWTSKFGPMAWIRLRHSTALGSGFLFLVASDYKNSWRSSPGTCVLWKIMISPNED